MSFYNICRNCQTIMELKREDNDGSVLVCPKCGFKKEVKTKK